MRLEQASCGQEPFPFVPANKMWGHSWRRVVGFGRASTIVVLERDIQAPQPGPVEMSLASWTRRALVALRKVLVRLGRSPFEPPALL